jgi:Ca-activated chloride channel family protein
MRFADPFWLLLALPVLAAWLPRFFRREQGDGLQYTSLRILERVLPSRPVRPEEILNALFYAGLLLAIIALARPQWGTTSEEVSGRGVDLVLCLDTSGSMASVDFKPQNRLGAALDVAKVFVNERKRDRIGLVAFGGIALTLSPLTSDKRALQELLGRIQINMTEVDGTAIGMALATSVDRLRASRAASRVIVLLTDGRSNQGAIDPLTAAKTAAAFGIKVYTVGAGSPEGGLMPIQDPLFGTRFVRMENDLDEGVLREIAAITRGLYFRAKDTQGLASIFSKINQMEKSEYKISTFTHFKDLYFPWLVVGSLLVAAALILRQTALRRVP